MKRILTTALTVALGLMAVYAVNPKPFVIPELRGWHGGDGTYTPAPGFAVTYSDTTLRHAAEAYADDYGILFGSRPTVSQANKPVKGGIHFGYDRKVKGDEAYRVRIERGSVAVSASAPQGAFWATRTLLQLAEQDSLQALPVGSIDDSPAYGMRGMTIDCGRKYIPLSYLHKLVKILSYYKMNTLRVHLNDNGFVKFYGDDWDKTYAAFRLESDTFPGLTARDGFYTKREFRDFQRQAAMEGVEIIPEIDVPAHALAFSRYLPEIGSDEFGRDHLNLFHPSTMPFIDRLFDEYLGGDDPVFVGPRFHIGTDEFGKDYPGFDRLQETREQFRAFTDHYIRLVESYGKQPVVWGALKVAPGETPVKADGVVLDAWYNGYADPRQSVADGFKLYSVPDGMVYIVPMAGYYYDRLNHQWLYENWTPAHVGREVFDEGDPAILGGGFAEWNDHCGNGVTVKDIHNRVFPAIQTLAAKTWDGPETTLPYAEFDRLANTLSEAPGVNERAVWALDSTMLLSVSEVTPGMELELPEVGFPYTVQFTLDARAEEPGTVLLSSDNATFYLADPIGGLLGWKNDDYLRQFPFRPYDGEHLDIAIEGDNRSTTLYVNGRKVSTLDVETKYYSEDGKARQYHLHTLVFPLAKAGAFNSRVSNLRVYNRRLSTPDNR